MSRHKRLHFPGAAFHITARTQGQQRWFTEFVRDRVEQIILEGFATSDAQLIAGTVMPNHLHLVVKQGMRALGWTMQPVLRRIALLVQRTAGVVGHVFERPFHAKVCDTANYLRNAIVYTNLNPQRAGLCDRFGRYKCSSHERFLSGQDRPGCKSVFEVLRLFSNTESTTLSELCESYRRYVNWRLAKDAADAAGDLFMFAEPAAQFGDVYFASHFSPWQLRPQPQLRDLRDKARGILPEVSPNVELEQLKGKRVSRAASRTRREVIAALLQSGYRCKSIADFFQISDTTVSAVASAMRYNILGLNGIPEGGPQ